MRVVLHHWSSGVGLSPTEQLTLQSGVLMCCSVLDVCSSSSCHLRFSSPSAQITDKMIIWDVLRKV
jgi:hypothetical protein